MTQLKMFQSIKFVSLIRSLKRPNDSYTLKANLVSKLCFHKKFQLFSTKKPKIKLNDSKKHIPSQRQASLRSQLISDYMKLTLSNHQNKRQQKSVHKQKIHILIQVKVIFVSKNDKTSIEKVETSQQANDPSIIVFFYNTFVKISLNKSQHPPEGNKANEEIQRFWNNLLSDISVDIPEYCFSNCNIVSGKTNKRKQIAFFVETKNLQKQINLDSISKQLDTLIKRCI